MLPLASCVWKARAQSKGVGRVMGSLCTILARNGGGFAALGPVPSTPKSTGSRRCFHASDMSRQTHVPHSQAEAKQNIMIWEEAEKEDYDLSISVRCLFPSFCW